MRIHLQFVNGVFYPSDIVSKRTLLRHWGIETIPEVRFEYLMPTLVKKGFMFAINGWEFSKYDYTVPSSTKIGGVAKSTKNPCANCRLRDLCDADECGKKNYRLFSGK